MTKKQKIYAYVVPSKNEQGVCDTWDECARHVLGVYGARFKSFPLREEAEEWLEQGGEYAASKPKVKVKLQKGIYFDAGTGRGNGVEVSVTDEKGADLLGSVLGKRSINKFGKHLIKAAEATNNYGELLACKYALQIALRQAQGKLPVKKVFGDSALVVNFWSKGHTRKEVPTKTAALAQEVGALRARFEKSGGKVVLISGNDNPADLGFH